METTLNTTVNKVIVKEDIIELNGFPLVKDTGKFSVFHTKNTLTIRPDQKEGVYYTLFNICNKKIEKAVNIKEYTIFRLMLESFGEKEEYYFAEVGGLYYIIT